LEHLFEPLLRHLKIRANVVQLGVTEQKLDGLNVRSLLD
jgi:hypothetical protein